MNLLRQAALFWKYAQEHSQKEYNNHLARCKASLNTDTPTALEYAGEFINNWGQSPYYKQQDGIDLVMNSVKDDSSYRIETLVSHLEKGALDVANLSPYIHALTEAYLDMQINKMRTIPLKSAAWAINDLLGVTELTIEQEKKKNAAILQYLLEKPQEISTAEEERHLIDVFRFLKRVHWAPVTLLNLARKAGPDFYARVVHVGKLDTYVPQVFEEHKPELLMTPHKKDKFTQYDIASWFNYLAEKNILIEVNQFMRVLQRCTKEAIDYLRGYLYTTNSKDFFMLDESLQPMNSQMDSILWPDHFVAIKLSDVQDKAQQAEWQQVFHDFQIIPVQ